MGAADRRSYPILAISGRNFCIPSWYIPSVPFPFELIPMQFMLLIYNDPRLLGAVPTDQADSMMRQCLDHADDLRRKGQLLESQMLEPAETAKAVRIRNGRSTVMDGPFSEAKEVLGGFNLIEADSIEDAIQIALQFPWAQTGCVEVRPVRDIEAVRRRVAVEARL